MVTKPQLLLRRGKEYMTSLSPHLKRQKIYTTVDPLSGNYADKFQSRNRKQHLCSLRDAFIAFPGKWIGILCWSSWWKKWKSCSMLSIQIKLNHHSAANSVTDFKTISLARFTRKCLLAWCIFIQGSCKTPATVLWMLYWSRLRRKRSPFDAIIACEQASTSATQCRTRWIQYGIIEIWMIVKNRLWYKHHRLIFIRSNIPAPISLERDFVKFIL